jgi:hypothetical protein
MKRFGPEKLNAKQAKETELFLMRLHLLIVMVKASLKGYPVGKYRKQAALDNATYVHKLISDLDISFLNLNSSAHLFKERVKLLSVMATAIVSEDYPLGIHRREAVMDNIDMIIEYVFPEAKFDLFHDVLKVA